MASLLIARGHRVVGVDGSVDMLDRARHLVPGLAVASGDVADLPLPHSAADLVVCGLALTHVADLVPVFSEFARVLRPGGDLVISDVHPDLVLLGSVVTAVGPDGQPQQAATYRHPPTTVLRAALAAGFGVLRCEEEPRPESRNAPLEPAGEPQPAGGPEPAGAPVAAQTTEPDRAYDIGEWADWPWSLLGLVPEATRAAWTNPSVIVWHFRRL